MRHLAWLNAVPEKDAKHRSRRRMFDEAKPPIKYSIPECDGIHIAEYMFEIGIGESGISHAELQAWQANTGIALQPWECRFIKSLSGEYMGELMRAKKDVKSPWDGADIDTRALVALQMKESVRGL